MLLLYCCSIYCSTYTGRVPREERRYEGRTRVQRITPVHRRAWGAEVYFHLQASGSFTAAELSTCLLDVKRSRLLLYSSQYGWHKMRSNRAVHPGSRCIREQSHPKTTTYIRTSSPSRPQAWIQRKPSKIDQWIPSDSACLPPDLMQRGARARRGNDAIKQTALCTTIKRLHIRGTPNPVCQQQLPICGANLDGEEHQVDDNAVRLRLVHPPGTPLPEKPRTGGPAHPPRSECSPLSNQKYSTPRN